MVDELEHHKAESAGVEWVPWIALGLGCLFSGAALGVALYTARSTAALAGTRHEGRCVARHEEQEENFRKLRREFAALSEDVTADVETAATERQRAGAAAARAAKAAKAAPDEPAQGETRDAWRARMKRERWGRSA